MGDSLHALLGMTLPPELSRLADELEDAAGREVRRRRRVWAARTATVGALLACVSASFAPQALAPAERAPEPFAALVASTSIPGCADIGVMRHEPCREGAGLMTDAAHARESASIVPHRGDASQSGAVEAPGWIAGHVARY